jgi:hypothetical protein
MQWNPLGRESDDGGGGGLSQTLQFHLTKTREIQTAHKELHICQWTDVNWENKDWLLYRLFNVSVSKIRGYCQMWLEYHK